MSFDLELVRALRSREHRAATGQYVIEGVRFLIAASDAGADFAGLVICERLLTSTVGQMIVRRLRRAQVPVLKVDEARFATVGRLVEGTGRGVVSVVRQRWRCLDRLGEGDVWLAVESVRSPGNLGTLARTCLAAGVRGIIVTGDADLHDPACVRATMGALDALELVRITPHELIALTRRSRGRLIGAAPDGARDYRAISYRGPTVVLVGSERSGISDAMRAALDVTVRIPMTRAIDSLNLAVAGSLILYEAYAQRR